jgi:sensor histidine kinase regulating citrate/malate metabolism
VPRQLTPPRPLDRVNPLLLVQTWLLLLLLIAGALVVLVEGRHDAQAKDRELVLGVARTVANSPFVFSSALTPDPATRLGPYAEAVRRANGLDFVVIMAPDRTRWTHPDPARVGKKFAGRIQPALDGATITETFASPADPRVQAVSPVLDGKNKVVALVAVGASNEAAASEGWRQLPLLVLVVLLAAALAYGSGPLARRVERQRSARSSASAARVTEA